MPSKLTRIIAAATISFGFIGGSDAFWRLLCDISGVARIDPLVNPGERADHAHNIYGGDAFSMSSSSSDLLGSSCSSCQVKQDKSAYWTPNLYFKFSNGSLTPVTRAQHISYYKYTSLMVKGGEFKVPEAFPAGFQMISGDTYQRNFSGLPVPDPPKPWSGDDVTQEALERKSVGFNCMKYCDGCDEPSLYRHFLPTKEYMTENCPNGIRMEILFPQCWNGELDSPKHKSHVAYASALLDGGSCPDGFDRVLPQLFYETYMYPQDFYKYDGEFVLTNGDPTGYGYHGDFINAWEEGVLQKALDQCGPSDDGDTTHCPVFEINGAEEQAACQLKIPKELDAEDCTAESQEMLPGDVTILSGPDYAKQGGKPAPKAESPVEPIVPTLSFSAGSSASGTYQGNILVQVTPSTSAEVSSWSSASPPPPPSPTPAPPAQAPVVAVKNKNVDADPMALELSTITTTYYTEGREAYEVVVIAKEVTVTVAAGATPAPVPEAGYQKARKERKRHLHKHQHHHPGHLYGR